jgi:hypothetical protein
MIPIGYENYVNSNYVVAILKPDSAPVKRIRDKASGDGKLINATSGRKARSLIVTENNHVVLSALQPETLKLRLKNLTK